MHNGPLTDGPLSVCAFCALFLYNLFEISLCHYTLMMLGFFRVFSSCFAISNVYFFRVAFFSCFTFFMLHSFPCCTPFSCFAISNVHFFRVALFSCCTLSMLHFSLVALFWCWTFFTLHVSHVALLPYRALHFLLCLTLFVFPLCCTFFMFHFFCVALFSCCILFMLHSFPSCTLSMFCYFQCTLF